MGDAYFMHFTSLLGRALQHAFAQTSNRNRASPLTSTRSCAFSFAEVHRDIVSTGFGTWNRNVLWCDYRWDLSVELEHLLRAVIRNDDSDLFCPRCCWTVRLRSARFFAPE